MALAVRPVFSSSAEGPAVRIDRLRRALCTAETATGLAGEVGVPLTLGIPLIDDVLGGGLSGSALHEIAATRETEIAAATGFALALAALASEASGQRGHAIVRAPDTRLKNQVRRRATPPRQMVPCQTVPHQDEMHQGEMRSGSPRTSRSPRMARPMDPVCMKPASFPNT